MSGRFDSVKWDEQERRDEEAIRRIHALVAHGYVPELGARDGVDNAIFFNHLADGPQLLFYPGGRVVTVNRDIILKAGDDGQLGNEEEGDVAAFQRFLGTLKKPTWRQRTRSDREKYIYVPGCMLLIVALGLAFAKAAEWMWESLTH